MITVFIDSDILLDSILAREPFFDAATNLMTLADDSSVKLCTSVHSLLNVHYLSKKHYGEKLSRQAIKELTAKLGVVSEHADFIQNALISDLPILKMQFNIMMHKVPKLILSLPATPKTINTRLYRF